MAEVFFISDTHFGHNNILNFKDRNGNPLRPFNTIHEMHVAMTENWNRVVKPQDKVYHLGDVAFTQNGLKILGLLNGHKRLVRGNHDGFKLKSYLQFFEEVYGVRQIDGYWLSHVPLYQGCVEGERFKANIHGHLHGNVIDHPKYVSVCVEKINYTPIPFDEIRAKYEKK